jgi:arabinofuranosyltransferase
MISPDLVLEGPPAVGADDLTDPAGAVDTASSTPVAAPPAHRGLQAAVLAIPIVVLAILAWVDRSMFYDGYIYLHVVQNILAGHGPVFNAGQRVEAFTSPAWTALVTMAALVTPFSLTTIAVDLGVMLTVGGLLLAVVSSARLVRRASPDSFLLPIGALVFAAVPAVWSLASLGMETGLSFFWLGACLALLARWAARRGPAVSAGMLVVLGLGPLVRPELGLDSLVFIGVVLTVDRAHRAWRGNVRILVWAAALPLAYQVFRMGYYGMIVANTAVAKEASLPRVGRGVQYFMDFAGTYWMVVPAVCLAVGAYPPVASALRRTDGGTRNVAVLFAFPVAGILNAAYIVLMGGDYVHARLLVAPLFALVAPVAVVPLGRRYVISLLVIPWALLCAFGLRSNDSNPFSLSPFVVASGNGNVDPPAWSWTHEAAFADPAGDSGAWLQFNATKAPVRLNAPTPPGLVTPVIATSQIGAAPYELGTGVQVLDLLGLADPLTAHLQLSHRGQFTGHEKPLPTPWVQALLTAPGSSTAQIGALQAFRPVGYNTLIPQVTGRALDVQTAWARAALTCPAIHALEYGPNRPLTLGSFLANMVHSVSRTTVRIPPDPETAYHRFCGPGTPAQVTQVLK